MPERRRDQVTQYIVDDPHAPKLPRSFSSSRPADRCVELNPREPYPCQRGECHASWFSHSDRIGCAQCTCPGFVGKGPAGRERPVEWVGGCGCMTDDSEDG